MIIRTKSVLSVNGISVPIGTVLDITSCLQLQFVKSALTPNAVGWLTFARGIARESGYIMQEYLKYPPSDEFVKALETTSLENL